jgi:hypothetical protein
MPGRGASLHRQDAAAEQEMQLARLVRHEENTRFGRDHSFAKITSIAEFQARVPLRRYEDMWRDYWQPAFPSLVDCTWPGTIPYFALSSGTTSGTTKYIPCSREMNRANDRAALDVLAHHIANRPKAACSAARASCSAAARADGTCPDPRRDLSGIAAARMPFWRAALCTRRAACFDRRLGKRSSPVAGYPDQDVRSSLATELAVDFFERLLH